ncbi:MAG: hypothetical protein IAF58_17910 [Leptolyngbya sp.]|nr:hypothetical protein [Candidatus Melainabacteria bacterium]
MSGNCPMCGAPLNLGLNFCVVCGRRSSTNESSKILGLKSVARQADMTAKIELDGKKIAKIAPKPKTALRFRKVRGIWTQSLYVVVGICLFFVAVRFALDRTAFHHEVQRSVHALLQKDPLKALSGSTKQPGKVSAPTKAATKKARKKRTRRTHRRAKTVKKQSAN